MKITADRLRRLLSYDPASGLFTRLEACPGHAAGSPVGTVADRGYRVIKIDGKSYKAHRLAWLHVTGRWPAQHVDHVNGDTSDNRWVNLREATRSQNLANSRRYKNSTSAFKGVAWHKASRRWSASIQVHGRRCHLGLFDTAHEAHARYVEAARRLFGEFARAA